MRNHVLPAAMVATFLLAGANTAMAVDETWGDTGLWSDPWYVFAGDFNCNGTTDFVSAQYNVGVLHLSDGNDEFYGGMGVPIGSNWSQGPWTFVGDFNGDGCDDIASVTGGTAYMKWGAYST